MCKVYLYYVTLQERTLQQTMFLFLVLAHSLVNSAMLETKTEQAPADSRQRSAGAVTIAMLGPGLYFPLPLPDTRLCRQLRPERGEKPAGPLLPLCGNGHLLHWGYFLLDWLMLLGIRLINIWHHTMSQSLVYRKLFVTFNKFEFFCVCSWPCVFATYQKNVHNSW